MSFKLWVLFAFLVFIALALVFIFIALFLAEVDKQRVLREALKGIDEEDLDEVRNAYTYSSSDSE